MSLKAIAWKRPDNAERKRLLIDRFTFFLFFLASKCFCFVGFATKLFSYWSAAGYDVRFFSNMSFLLSEHIMYIFMSNTDVNVNPTHTVVIIRVRNLKTCKSNHTHCVCTHDITTHTHTHTRARTLSFFLLSFYGLELAFRNCCLALWFASDHDTMHLL